MIALVNGYLCRNTSDAARAMQGKDPNAPSGAPPYSSGSKHKIPALPPEPVPIVDQALKALMGSTPIHIVTALDSAKPTGVEIAAPIDTHTGPTSAPQEAGAAGVAQTAAESAAAVVTTKSAAKSGVDILV